MPPKNNNRSWWIARQKALEATTGESRNLSNDSGPPNGKNSESEATQALEATTGESRNLSNDSGPPNGRNSESEATQALAGMPELIEFINALGAATPGTRPQLNAEQIERVKKSQLRPVLQALQPIYRKIVEAPAEAPAAAGITNAEAGLQSVTSKLNSVSQAVLDVKQSAKAVKDQAEAVDKKISQLSGTWDPALADLTQEVKRLKVDLVAEFTAERTRLETKVKRLETEVGERGEKIKGLEGKNRELKKEAKDLRQVIRDTKEELVPVKVASEIALQGTFSDTLDTRGDNGGRAGSAPDNLLQTTMEVRDNTLNLITNCRALFTLIDHNPEIDPDISDLSMEGEWGRCAEHIRTVNSKLRGAEEEKEETAQNLEFIGLVIDQMRKGNNIHNLTEDLPRMAARSTIRPKPLAAKTGVQDEGGCGGSKLSDLNNLAYLA
ncbi:hypothetical protein FRC01_002682 [Tulasnella sp. 417]|nr:hypothetical protein FRC01_002682 [Tulasnella sp. 417]